MVWEVRWWWSDDENDGGKLGLLWCCGSGNNAGGSRQRQQGWRGRCVGGGPVMKKMEENVGLFGIR